MKVLFFSLLYLVISVECIAFDELRLIQYHSSPQSITQVYGLRTQGYDIELYKNTVHDDPKIYKSEIGDQNLDVLMLELSTFLKRYYTRRDWTQDLIDSFTDPKKLKSSFHQSDLIIVRDPVNREIVSTLRLVNKFVSAPNQTRLPVENFFSTDLLGQDPSFITEFSSLAVATSHKSDQKVKNALFSTVLFSLYLPTVALESRLQIYEDGSIARIQFSERTISAAQLMIKDIIKKEHGKSRFFAYGDRAAMMYFRYGMSFNPSKAEREFNGQQWKLLESDTLIMHEISQKLNLVDDVLSVFEFLSRYLNIDATTGRPWNNFGDDLSHHMQKRVMSAFGLPEAGDFMFSPYSKNSLTPIENTGFSCSKLL